MLDAIVLRDDDAIVLRSDSQLTETMLEGSID